VEVVLSGALWESWLAVVERDMLIRTDFIASSVSISNSFQILPVCTPKGAHFFRSVPGLSKISFARLQAAVTTIGVNMSRCVSENAMRQTTVCLEMDGDRFE
jgi:hypothetical protein